MDKPTKLTTTVIWFAILSGLFIILHFAAGGVGTLSGEIDVQSMPLMLVGVIPLIVGVIGRMVVIPKAKTNEAFTSLMVLSLAMCEAPAILGMLAFPKEFVTERTFAFVGSVIGVLVLFPMSIRTDNT